MYRNLAPRALGLAGCRDHELVELALTYRFTGIEYDLERFGEHVRMKGMDAARRYLTSAPLRVTPAALQLSWDENDDTAQQFLAKLPDWLNLAQELGCTQLVLQLSSGNDHRPYHENFEFHRRWLQQFAEVLAQSQFSLAVGFSAVRSDRGNRAHSFIDTPEALLALVKVMDADNFKAVVDLWQWTLGGGTMDQVRELGIARIADVRLADLPEGYSAEGTSHEDRLLPGSTGVVDHVAALQMLAEMDYDGSLTPVPHRRQLKVKSRDEGVERTAKQLDQLMEDAGLVTPAGVGADGAEEGAEG